ncbi:MAG: spore coat protein [Bacillota bacterium]|jgi:similar to spore coat protein
MYSAQSNIHNQMTTFIDDKTIAADLLNGVKAGIKSTASALTEAATPEVRRTLQRQLQDSLNFHEQLTNFMMQKGWYHAYNVNQMVQSDIQAAQKLQSLMQQSQSMQGQPYPRGPQYQQIPQYGQFVQPQYNQTRH